jgi:hypothetical protein
VDAGPGYSFDLRTNEILPKRIKNPGAGTAHSFRAWRLKGSPIAPVSMRNVSPDDMVAEGDGKVGEEC